MENSIMSKENGGGWEYSLIPELEYLAKENINFSHNNNIGGPPYLQGAQFTAAAMAAYTSGTPLLKLPILEEDYAGYSFLPGVYSMGDILKKEGYNLKLMVGSDSKFGGRKDYFTTHGNYEIFDLNTAIEEEKMKKEEKVWWGYSDDNLFKWAKDEILELADKQEPFNFMMLTADTHFPDGYLSENAEKKFDTQYENVFAHSSKLVNEFIGWLKQQSFYENTTIVLVGDHLGMQQNFYKENLDSNYSRRIYNCIINSAIPEENSKNRQYSVFDMFPTVLASIGVKIEGNRLGLGTNLFSGEKTLTERIGNATINKELKKKSIYYNLHLLQDDYLEMLNDANEE